MRWEIFHNADTNIVTVIDAPEGHEFEIPPGVGSSIGNLVTEPGTPFIVSKSNPLLKTWLTERFAILGIDTLVERIVHLPML